MSNQRRKPKDIEIAEAKLARAAEAYPDVIEAGPWGHRAFKIRNKTFMFLSTDEGVLSFSLKLPWSGKSALGLGFTEPTHYGLGKSGWVTARFASGQQIPIPTIVAWIDESFRAIAPKQVVSAMPTRSVAEPSASTRKPAAKRGSSKRTAKKKGAPNKTAAKKASPKRGAPQKRRVKKPFATKAGN